MKSTIINGSCFLIFNYKLQATRSELFSNSAFCLLLPIGKVPHPGHQRFSPGINRNSPPLRPSYSVWSRALHRPCCSRAWISWGDPLTPHCWNPLMALMSFRSSPHSPAWFPSPSASLQLPLHPGPMQPVPLDLVNYYLFFRSPASTFNCFRKGSRCPSFRLLGLPRI